MTRYLLIQLIATLLLGYTPLYCDSCGMLTPPDAMTTCDACGAQVCRICADSYAYTVPGSGLCFYCDDSAPCGQLPDDYDYDASGCVDVGADMDYAYDVLMGRTE